MQLTRRELCRLGVATVTLSVIGLPALAASEATQAAIDAFTGGTAPQEGGIDVGAPEIAENGNTVPSEVSADGASEIIILADGNPNPGVATFKFGPLSGESLASTRIRLAGTQDIIAVAKMGDGSFRMAARTVKVTIGGCGG